MGHMMKATTCRKTWYVVLVVCWWMALEVTSPQHLVTATALQTRSIKRLLQDAVSPPPSPTSATTAPPPPPGNNRPQQPGDNRPPPPPPDDDGRRPGDRGPPPPMMIIQTVNNGETQLTQKLSPDQGPGRPPPPPRRLDGHPPPPGGNICGTAPYLLTRNDDGGATSNGNCDNAANSTVLSCTCLVGLNTTDWKFELTPQSASPLVLSGTAPPTSVSVSDSKTPLPVNSIGTIQATSNLLAIRFIGTGTAPIPIRFVLSGPDSNQLVTLNTKNGQSNQLSTVELMNLDLSKVVLQNGFVPRSITQLTMRNCNLGAIFTGFLTGVQQLTTLDVSQNRLTNIYDGLLQGSCGSSACVLEELNLSDNNFTKIPELLANLSNLKIVRFSGNPIKFPPMVSKDLYQFIQNLQVFEFNATVTVDAVKSDQVRTSCGHNGVIQLAHNLEFCVSSTSSSSDLNGTSSGAGKTSVVTLVLIIVGSVVFVIVLVVFLWCLWCRSGGGGEDTGAFTFTSRFKRQGELEAPLGVYGGGAGGDRSGNGAAQRPGAGAGANGYELFDEEDTFAYDESMSVMDMSLLQDPFLVTARIPFDAIRFGACMKKGGFGVVYSGIYNRRKVAIKKLRNDRNGTLRNVENFIKEVCLIASLKHPRIVEFIGVAWDSLRNFCAVMELMEKGDLKQVLVSFSKRSASSKANMRNLFLRKRAIVAGLGESDGANASGTRNSSSSGGSGGGGGSAVAAGAGAAAAAAAVEGKCHSSLSDGPQSMEFPEFSWQNHKRHIMSHVADALTYLHSLQPKIIHRDLKSKNILLNNSMEAKLSDFGIARERKIDESHLMTAGVGTSFWIAPEVLLGKNYDERADIFSFGVVMCEMDTGEYPYRQMNQIAKAAQQAAGMDGQGSSPPTQQPPCNKYQYTTILQLVAHGQLRPEMSVNCPPEIADLANDCLAMDPELRPTAAEIVYRLSQLQSQSQSQSQLPIMTSADDNNDEARIVMQEDPN